MHLTPRGYRNLSATFGPAGFIFPHLHVAPPPALGPNRNRHRLGSTSPPSWREEGTGILSFGWKFEQLNTDFSTEIDVEKEPFHGFPWYLEDVCEALQEIATTCSSHHFEVPKDISGKPPPSHLGQIIWDAHLRRKGIPSTVWIILPTMKINPRY